MFKVINKIIFFAIFFSSNYSFALNSSSYLIGNSAVNLFDFEKAKSEFLFADEKLGETYLHSKLLTYVNLNDFDESQNVASEILKINKNNQEAWIVYLANAKLKNNLQPFEEYLNSKNINRMDLIDYIFFDSNNQIKKSSIIAKSIFEVVRGSISEDKNQINYNFLLFYLSVSNYLDPNFHQVHFLTGQIYDILKKYKQAELYYKKIKVTDDLYIISQINIAKNKNKIGLYIEAEKSLLNLVNLYKNNKFLLISLADFYNSEKKYTKAIEHYSSVLTFKDISLQDKWRIFYMRGICYERIKKWKLAEKDFLDSLNIKQDSPQVMNYLAYGWLERDQNIDLAMNLLNKAYAANPESYHILDSLAWAYFKKNELVRASELMEKVIEMAPGEAISLDHLADIYYATNRKREASFFWRQVLELAEPEDMIIEDVKRKLEIYYAG